LLYFIWKGASRQFVHPEVKGNALAAFALSGAGFVRAVALGFIGFDITFHSISSALIFFLSRKAR
jgi:hypothetical protein